MAHSLDADAVVFDAGNTIIHLDYPFICDVLAQHGVRFEPIEFQTAEYSARAMIDRELAPGVVVPESIEGMIWGDGERPSYFGAVLRKLGVGDREAAPILESLKQHNEERCLWRVPEPDTKDVLRSLKERGLRLAVVSNADGRVEGDLRAAGFGEYFETIIDSKVVGVEKPDPRIFGIALDRLGVTAARAVYVGDVYGIDVIGSRRAGMTPVLLDRLGRYTAASDCWRIRALAELLG